MRGPIALVAFWLMQKLALNPKPALAAAWALVIAGGALLAFTVHLVANGG